MDEAIALLDTWLATVSSRNMFTADEVQDLLLDFRVALTRDLTLPKAS